MKVQTSSFASGSWSKEPDGSLDSEQTLVVIFGASQIIDQPGPIQRVIEAYPRSKIIGCSSSGEIHGTRVLDDSLAVAVAKFDRVALRLAQAPISGTAESLAAGREIAGKLNAPDLRAVLMLSDGLHVNGSELVRGVNSILPASVTVTGGLAGDGDRFKRTWVIADRRLTPGFVAAVGLYGDATHVGHGSKGGWDPFGVERLVTRSKGNMLFELDGKPALQLYKQYLGLRASELPAAGLLFPLTLRSGPDQDKRLVLGERAEEETEATLEVLPQDTQQIGFYSYGEISPYTTGHCDLHNQTMTLTAISEA